jgi:hypothetical protein
MDSDAESDTSTESVYIDCPHCNGEGQIATHERRPIPVRSRSTAAYGLAVPGPVHPLMLKFMDLEPRTKVSRATWFNEFNAYVNANYLKNGTVIRLDNKLAALNCDSKEGDVFTMFQLVKLHSSLFYTRKEAAAIKIQTLYRCKVARQQTEHKRLCPENLLNPQFKERRIDIAGVQSTVSKMKV